MGSDFPIFIYLLHHLCFNPRSHMGSDSRRYTDNRGARGFNPRSHMGSDLPLAKCSFIISVSIHAPTWGATLSQIVNTDCVVFQSTLPHGERPISRLLFEIAHKFQSTLPHGERPSCSSYSGRMVLFQSTLPHGERRF